MEEFSSFCKNHIAVRFRIYLPDGRFEVSYRISIGFSRWTHVVLNYLGPNGGIRVYSNGREKTNDLTKEAGSYSSGDPRVVLGRLFTELHRDYAGGDFDELLFFNEILSQEQIIRLEDIV